MPDSNLAFDHVHLVAKDPHAAAKWYVDKLGGEIVRTLLRCARDDVSCATGLLRHYVPRNSMR